MKKRGYVHRIAAAVENNPELFPPGEGRRVQAHHDKWCKSYKGKPCNCYPDITMTSPLGSFSIGHAGECFNQN